MNKLIYCLACIPTLFANPELSQIISGNVSLLETPQLLEITASDRSIIEWNSFSIGADEMVSFLQPSSASIVLNRVVGQDMSELLGTLKANGTLYLINPRGILVGENGLIDTASFLASTLDLSNQTFLEGGELLFQGASDAPLIHLGKIEAKEGDVLLMAHHVQNKGSIIAPDGTVSFTAGHEILLKSPNQPLLNIRPDLEALGIDNSGVIEALSVYLQSHSLSTLALEQRGKITLVEEGGKIFLSSEGGPIYIQEEASLVAPGGEIEIRLETQEESKPLYLLGKLDVSGKQGGSIQIEAPKMLNAGLLKAHGQETGGEIHLSIQETLIETTAAKTSASGVISYDSSSLFSSGSIATEGALHLFSDKISLVGGELNVKEKIFNPSTRLYAANDVGMLTVTSEFPQTPLVDPNAGSGTGFGNAVTVLSTGKIVVTKPSDNFAATAAGAVYLYNGQTGSLISTITGSTANDQIGSSGITALTGNGNYIFRSPNWDLGAITNVGAVTWGNGETGVSGTVSSANSLIGSTGSDGVGTTAPSALSNGNYVVPAPLWDRINGGVLAGVGAATWGNGTTGITGTVSINNSLIGSTLNDGVGTAVLALTNGNYVVSSINWDRIDGGVLADVGAATWGDGTTGVTGTVSINNSLIGSTASDQISSNATTAGLVALTNGNYVVRSEFWNRVDGGILTDVGAATWGNGTTGITGTVSVANSLIGSTANDRVTNTTVIALTNGNYVVLSRYWDRVDGGILTNVGAATWGSGTTGITGTVSVNNSLIGSTGSDVVSSPGVVALSNGNYVVCSSAWDRVDGGTVLQAGAATWGNGTTGTTGTVSVTNSLIGFSPGDAVATSNVTALTNGNYVVRSTSWNRFDGGTVNGVGAATWGNGATGITGTVSVNNSLIGSSASDSVGGSGIIALTNGNYVVRSQAWDRVDGGAVTNAGAATWGNGTTGITGTVSVTNSLIGSTGSDLVSGTAGTALTNGNYVVGSSSWDRVDGGTVTDVGAATWGSGTTGITGTVSITNSLIGSKASDNVSSTGITALTNGNYVVTSANWDWTAQSLTNSGAATRGDGTTGITGTVTTTNSVLGETGSSSLQAAIDNNSAVANTFVVRFTGGQGAVIIGGIANSSSSSSSASSSVIVGGPQARIDYGRSITESFQVWEYRLFGPYLSDDFWTPIETAKRFNLVLPSLVIKN